MDNALDDISGSGFGVGSGFGSGFGSGSGSGSDSGSGSEPSSIYSSQGMKPSPSKSINSPKRER